MTIKVKLGWWLRRFADRINPSNAPRALGTSFTYERGEGIRYRDDGKGCALWYLSEDTHDKAFTESDTKPQWIDWATMTLKEY